MSKNLKYTTSQIADFYTSHRSRWDDFYPSEKYILERIAERHSLGRVLDVGCAAGGLGLALIERFPIASYTGVDINPPSIEAALARRERFPTTSRFYCADVLELRELDGEEFDTVVNLSCADWNVETQTIIEDSWKRVASGGWLIISLRLTNGPGINDMRRSFQIIDFNHAAGENSQCANYVVFNVFDALNMFARLKPAVSTLTAYGYWGPPSRTAVTPYSKLVFTVFGLRRAGDQLPREPTMELMLPLSALTDVLSLGQV